MEEGHVASLIAFGGLTATFIGLMVVIWVVRINVPTDPIAAILWTPMGIISMIIGYIVLIVICAWICLSMAGIEDIGK